MKRSPYNLIHALAATAVLGVLIFARGFDAFWRQFVYGLNQVMTPELLKQNLLASTALFGGLILVLWLCAKFIPSGKRKAAASADANAPDRLHALRTAALATLVITPVALGLCWLGAHSIEWLTGVKPADQDLVRCFTDGQYSLGLRIVMVLAVLIQAPVLEELLFRGIIFRGFASSMPLPVAFAISGFVFAIMHINAASFVALWFLGVAFAWLYARTRTLLASITAHLLFNGANLLVLLFFPEIAAG